MKILKVTIIRGNNDDRLQMFSGDTSVRVKRLALNMNQVQTYNPPPNPAKLTDTRATDYIAKFGDSSWELDALDPKVIDDLIATNIEMYIDYDKWDEIKEKETKSRERMMEMAKEWKD